MKVNGFPLLYVRCEPLTGSFLSPYANLKVEFRAVQAVLGQQNCSPLSCLIMVLIFLTWGWSAKGQLVTSLATHELRCFALALL